MANSTRSSVVLKNCDCLVGLKSAEMGGFTINGGIGSNLGGIHMVALCIDWRSVVDKVEMHRVLTDDLCIEA